MAIANGAKTQRAKWIGSAGCSAKMDQREKSPQTSGKNTARRKSFIGTRERGELENVGRCAAPRDESVPDSRRDPICGALMSG